MPAATAPDHTETIVPGPDRPPLLRFLVLFVVMLALAVALAALSS